MSLTIARNIVHGLLMLALALPALGSHVCRCAKQASIQQTAAGETLRPCCAKRAAARKAESTAQKSTSGWKSRCCCSDIRWNQTVAKVIPVRAGEWIAGSQLVPAAGAIVVAHPATDLEASASFQERAGPPGSARVVLCRWQV